MTLLRSLLFAAIFYPGSLAFVALAVPVAAVWPASMRRYALVWAGFHRWCARWLLGIVTRVEGPVPGGPVLVASKHQAMYETMELVLVLDAPAVVLKRELADMPLWGRAAQHYGCIPVDREGSAAALRRMTKAARAAAATGRQVLIFPEGTRVPVGDAPALKAGFAGLYRTLGLPVVAVALDSGRLYPKGLLKRPGVVTMRFAEPIPPGLPRAAIEARVHAAINGLEPGFLPIADGEGDQP